MNQVRPWKVGAGKSRLVRIWIRPSPIPPPRCPYLGLQRVTAVSAVLFADQLAEGVEHSVEPNRVPSVSRPSLTRCTKVRASASTTMNSASSNSAISVQAKCRRGVAAELREITVLIGRSGLTGDFEDACCCCHCVCVMPEHRIGITKLWLRGYRLSGSKAWLRQVPRGAASH